MQRRRRHLKIVGEHLEVKDAEAFKRVDDARYIAELNETLISAAQRLLDDPKQRHDDCGQELRTKADDIAIDMHSISV